MTGWFSADQNWRGVGDEQREGSEKQEHTDGGSQARDEQEHNAGD
jgi:hypothetical protein